MQESQDLSVFFPDGGQYPVVGPGTLSPNDLKNMYYHGPFATYTGIECTPTEKGLQVWRINVSPKFFKEMLGDHYYIGYTDQLKKEVSPVFTIRGILYKPSTDTYMLVVEIDSCTFTIDPIEDYTGTEFLYEMYSSKGAH